MAVIENNYEMFRELMEKSANFRRFAEHIKETRGDTFTKILEKGGLKPSQQNCLYNITNPITEEFIDNLKANYKFTEDEEEWLEDIGLWTRSFKFIDQYVNEDENTKDLINKYIEIHK